MESKSLALWTGVFTLTLLALLVAMVVWMSGGGTRPVDYQLVASQSVAGLRPEAPVLLRGLQVGRLTSMRIDPVDMQKVRMTAKIDPGLHFSRKLHAKLGSQHGAMPGSPVGLMQDLVGISAEKWVSGARFTSLAEKFGATGVEAQIHFLTGLKVLMRDMPVKVFVDGDQRQTIFQAVQDALDAAIDKDDY